MFWVNTSWVKIEFVKIMVGNGALAH